MEIKQICEHCHNLNSVTVDNIRCINGYTEDGTHVRVTCYVCSECGEDNPVQIDDSYTVKLLDYVRELMSKAISANMAEKEVSNKLRRKIETKNAELDRCRKELWLKCQGTTIYDVADKKNRVPVIRIDYHMV